MASSIRFRIVRNDYGVLLTSPVVNGTPLARLIETFESDRGYDPAGGYGGLIGEGEYNGDPVAYYLGEQDSEDTSVGRVKLLACEDCGQASCWPLEAKVSADSQTVTWSEFSQPHRPTRDYEGFGPFIFERTQYDEALREVSGPASA